MCSVNGTLGAVDRAAVGVLGFVDIEGRPRACAVTPYVLDGVAAVTSTLAFIAKMEAIRAHPGVALLAGGVEVRGDADVQVRDAEWFDRHLRAAELRKYPPARRLLALPLHRRMLWWYLGRVVASLPEAAAEPRPGQDTATVTWVAPDGRPRIHPLAAGLDERADRVVVPDAVPAGPACVLFHEEDEAMADLRQVELRGVVSNGVLEVARRRGSLEPGPPSSVGQLAELRRLARAAKRNRARLESWRDESDHAAPQPPRRA